MPRSVSVHAKACSRAKRTRTARVEAQLFGDQIFLFGDRLLLFGDQPKVNHVNYQTFKSYFRNRNRVFNT